MNTFLISIAMLFSFSVAADTTYVIRPGDTILKISDRLIESSKSSLNRYQMARRIRAKNPKIKDFNSLTPGEVINLPEDATAVAKPAVVPEPVEEPAPAVAQPTPVATEEAEKAPPARDAKIEEHNVEHHHANFLLIQPRFQMHEYGIDVESTHTHHKSEGHVVGIGLGWGFAIGKKTHLLVLAGANHADLKKFSSETLSETNQWIKNFGLGIEYHWLTHLKVELVAIYNEHLFILPETTGGFAVKNVAVPGAELVFDWGFWHFTSSGLGLTAGVEYAGSVTKYGNKFKAAVEPLASLYWQTNRPGRMNYRLAATYTLSGQSPEHEIEQHVTIIGLNFTMAVPL